MEKKNNHSNHHQENHQHQDQNQQQNQHQTKTSKIFKSVNHHNMLARAWINQKNDKQDNYNYIQNLNQYVKQNWKSDKYLKEIDKFQTTYKNLNTFKQLNHDDVIFMCVCDGHNGNIASKFVNSVAAYELYISDDYQNRKYAKALTKLFVNVHNSLVNSKLYKCEPNYTEASGTTANIVLITKNTTYFASLGNSPILICSKEYDNNIVHHIGGVHNRYNDNCINNIAQSKIPVIQQISESGESSLLSVGSGLPVVASLGDALYDVAVFNSLLKESKEFRRSCHGAFDKLVSQERLIEAFGNYLSDKDPNSYGGYLYRILNFKIDNIFLNGLLMDSLKLTDIALDPIHRYPLVVEKKNSDIYGFAIVTNGVVEGRLYEVKEPFLNKIWFNFKKDFNDSFHQAQISSRPPHTDDRAGILVWFTKNIHSTTNKFDQDHDNNDNDSKSQSQSQSQSEHSQSEQSRSQSQSNSNNNINDDNATESASTYIDNNDGSRKKNEIHHNQKPNQNRYNNPFNTKDKNDHRDDDNVSHLSRRHHHRGN